jgi:hypothetical protein
MGISAGFRDRMMQEWRKLAFDVDEQASTSS